MQRQRALHERLAERPPSDHKCPVVVLERPRQHLGRARGALIHQENQRKLHELAVLTRDHNGDRVLSFTNRLFPHPLRLVHTSQLDVGGIQADVEFEGAAEGRDSLVDATGQVQHGGQHVAVVVRAHRHGGHRIVALLGDRTPRQHGEIMDRSLIISKMRGRETPVPEHCIR